MTHTLPPLPYEYNALEPHIDEQTMRIHHTKHHQAYVDKLNAALVKYPELGEASVVDLLSDLNAVPEDIRVAVRNHGGGHVNHTFFWEIMGAGKGGEPQGEVAAAINETFGGFEKFKEEFTNAGLNRFGSGWAWLVVDNGKLAVTSTANQDNPISEGKIPVLGCDVWEHAYYLKHQSARNSYIQSWWNTVNWVQVEQNYQDAKR